MVFFSWPQQPYQVLVRGVGVWFLFNSYMTWHSFRKERLHYGLLRQHPARGSTKEVVWRWSVGGPAQSLHGDVFLLVSECALAHFGSNFNVVLCKLIVALECMCKVIFWLDCRLTNSLTIRQSGSTLTEMLAKRVLTRVSIVLNLKNCFIWKLPHHNRISKVRIRLKSGFKHAQWASQ